MSAWRWIALSVTLAACAGGCQTPQTAPKPGVYVDAAAKPGGDGSHGNPFQSLQAALERKRGDERIWLAPGDHTIPSGVRLSNSSHISGAGIGRTRLVLAGDAPANWSNEGGIVLEGLTLGGALQIKAGSLELKGAEVTGRLVLEDAVRVEMVDVGFKDSRGVKITGCGSANMTRVRFENTSGNAVELNETTLTGVEVTIKGTQKAGPGTGDGIVALGSVVKLDKSRVEAVADRGIAIKLHSMAMLSDVEMHDGKRSLLYVDMESNVEGKNLKISGATSCVFAASKGQMVLKDSQIGPCVRHGALISDRGGLEVDKSTFNDCPSGHISVIGDGTSLQASASTFKNAGDLCINVASTDEAVRIEGNTFEGCKGAAVGILRSTEVKIRANKVRDTALSATISDMGHGISAVDSHADIENNTVESVARSGIVLLRSSGKVSGNQIAGSGAAGINVGDRADRGAASIESNKVTGSKGAGIAVSNHPAVLTGNEVRQTAKGGLVGGDGILITAVPSAKVQSNVVSGNEGHGLRLDCAVSKDKTTVSDNTFAKNGAGPRNQCP